MEPVRLFEKRHAVRTVKITCLYSIEVDATRNVSCIEPGAVRACAQFSLHETRHFSA